MRKIRILSAFLAAAMMVCLLASCTANIGDPDAINDYVPDIMTMTDPDTGGVFTFAYGEGDTAILVKYSGKITSGDHVKIPEYFEQNAGKNDDPNAISAKRKVVAIGEKAFYHLAAIVEVTIPATVESIGDYAFAECTELPAVTLPDGVKAVGNFAFEGCTKLTSLNLGKSLETIGDFAIANCTALENITIPETVTTLGRACFWGDTALKALEVPASVTTMGALACYNCKAIESIKLTDSLTKIGEFCFVTEKSTLKDKIATDNLAADGYVAKYVAAIAEPTPETEAPAAQDTEPAA